ncbi:hypothetical protein PCC7424_5543 (plasmid) [Gloeothece citriformis PCC 7424]|uniref:Uncharacterized protein n=1 Tax=Gloeothece citriformis (strain PCC 7424) TaxID=65393 RepID=B7KMT8_GLOC7|nr:hypothetical protein [Gloeothece citriformis]ACK74110.1 hypothetical protein PCC7424_5543 [Gloeothece citriformis PCC 7424]
MTNTPIRIIRKRSSATDPTPAATDTSSLTGSDTGVETLTDSSDRTPGIDSDELDLSTIKLPPGFQAKLQQETAANSTAPPASVPIAVVQKGGNSLNEIKADLLLDHLQEFSDEEFWDADCDLRFALKDLSSDYMDFLLSYE